MNEVKTVYIPRRPQHDSFDGIHVSVYWVCPVCGGPRGEVYPARSYDGSRVLHCDGWRNACGHIDYYEKVVREAANNGLNVMEQTP
jgi:hypothetical protein